ncbi:unnamed protein product [Clonostachys chloroleuca]|uniref:NmrA-like domain-containing protein n=1 Tax=Clonostachys chloroleuca TaxID=1926264 RepID=A0AA35QC23_9HYPO|nr:unnamed protein product [Clonostachys chloroleuca]
MVNIAIAGGSGQVSQEILDALLASKKHTITILSRKGAPTVLGRSDIHWKTVDYDNKLSLVDALRGVHTVLSFIQLLSDPGQKSQRNLIDASIAAGVKRFSPSEYGSKGTVDMSWWEGKEKIREYLEEVNAGGQPGLFLNYLAYPHKTSKHVDPLQSVFDFENKRAILVEDHEDAIMTLTTVADLAAVIARAAEYEGKWPKRGGICGNRMTFSEVIELGGRIRGKKLIGPQSQSAQSRIADDDYLGEPFSIDKVSIKDLEAGDLKTSWNLEAVHKAVSDEQASSLLKAVSIGILLSSTKGAWDISNEWNELLPDFKFTQADDFLGAVWEGKL